MFRKSLGISSLSKGHWVMFILGFVLPVFWLVGAVLAPTAAASMPVPAGPPSGIDAGTRADLEMPSSISGDMGN